MLKKILIIKLVLTMFFSGVVFSYANAQEAAAYTLAHNSANWNMSRAISGVFQAVANARGFLSTDPRVINTMRQIGVAALRTAAVGGAGLAVVAGGVTAPAWVTILSAAGLAASIAFPTELADKLAVQAGETLQKWKFDLENWATVQVTNTAAAADNPALEPGQPYFVHSLGPTYGSTALSVAQTVFSQYYKNTDTLEYRFGTCVDGSSPGSIRCSIDTRQRLNNTLPWPDAWTNRPSEINVAAGVVEGSPVACPVGTVYHSGQCIPTHMPSFDGPSSVSEAISRLFNYEQGAPLNPQLIAGAVDTLWKAAASQDGYDGLPYVPSLPVTAADAANWQSENSTVWPTVGDFTRPITDVNDYPNGLALPLNPAVAGAIPRDLVVSSSQAGVNPAASSPPINLGADPGIGPPNLVPPSMEDIMKPIMNMLPDFMKKDFVFPKGQCPTWQIDVFDWNMKIEKHCELLDDMKPIVRGAALFVFSIASVIIILGA